MDVPPQEFLWQKRKSDETSKWNAANRFFYCRTLQNLCLDNKHVLWILQKWVESSVFLKIYITKNSLYSIKCNTCGIISGMLSRNLGDSFNPVPCLSADGIYIFISGSDVSLEVQNHVANCLRIPIWICSKHQHNMIKQTFNVHPVYSYTQPIFLKVILISINHTTICTVVQARFKLGVNL